MARLMDQIVGHGAVKEKILKMTSAKIFFGASLFAGPEGVGKKKMALAALQEINCEVSAPACGACQSCLKIESGGDVFLHSIEPEGGRVKIEQVRDAIQFLALKAWVKHRFVIINGAERITVQAANALLKSVEEPPEGCHFIFITSQISQVLPTIRSRCQVVQMASLSNQDLHQIFPKISAWQVHWSFGRVSLAERIQSEEWLEVRKAAINFLHSPHHPKVVEALSPLFSDADKIDFVFHCWMTYLRDAWMVMQGDRTQIYNSDILGFVEKFSERGSITELSDMVLQMRQDVVGNVDKNLQLDNFAIALGGL